MKLIVISGRSGSGKSTALQVLEDCGYNCIDNIPIGLVAELINKAEQHPPANSAGIAVCIDARNLYGDIADLPGILSKLPDAFEPSLVYMDANDGNLLKRFSETRRKHPLSDSATALAEALEAETNLLEPLADNANIVIDTTDMRYHDLRDYVNRAIVNRTGHKMAVLFQSFGFKYGVPQNADLVFDVRCLANPHWEPKLRHLPGTDKDVQDYITQHEETQAMLEDLTRFLERWLPAYDKTNRQYSTIAIGCTGGRHRSVCIASLLANHFAQMYSNTVVRHRDLNMVNRKDASA